jgi:hypothetical protein
MLLKARVLVLRQKLVPQLWRNRELKQERDWKETKDSNDAVMAQAKIMSVQVA